MPESVPDLDGSTVHPKSLDNLLIDLVLVCCISSWLFRRKWSALFRRYLFSVGKLLSHGDRIFGLKFDICSSLFDNSTGDELWAEAISLSEDFAGTTFKNSFCEICFSQKFKGGACDFSFWWHSIEEGCEFSSSGVRRGEEAPWGRNRSPLSSTTHMESCKNKSYLRCSFVSHTHTYKPHSPLLSSSVQKQIIWAQNNSTETTKWRRNLRGGTID